MQPQHTVPPPQAILLVQCAQNDFLRCLRPDEPLPTLVHVGRSEAERLMGDKGSLRGFLVNAHDLPPENLAIIHLIDLHDAQRDREHFDLFLPHCQEGSKGAELIAPIEELAGKRANTFKVHAKGMNDFHETGLVTLLSELLSGRDAGSVPIGVAGVWTNAKVKYLLYQLATEFGAAQLATCSALTGSSSLPEHFNALRHLKDIVGIRIFHSPAGFLQWLVPDASVSLPDARTDHLKFEGRPRVPGAWDASKVAERDRLLVSWAGEETNVQLTPLGGGFSGAQVFIARSAEWVSVVKIGPRDETAKERFANELVGRVLRGYAPALHAYREGPSLALMDQALADAEKFEAEGPFGFQELAQGDLAPETTLLLEAALRQVLERALGPLYLSAGKDNAELLSTYCFTDIHRRPMFVEGVTGCAARIARQAGCGSSEEFLKGCGLAPGWLTPEQFYCEVLPGRSMMREVFTGMVHADLNLVNILLARRNGAVEPAKVWLIDFARLTPLPVLTDFAKIENDLSYIVLPLDNREDFQRALRLQETRLASVALEVDELIGRAETPAEERYVRLISTLRRIAGEVVDPRGAEAMECYRPALLRYAAHTLSFSEPQPLQLQLALAGCARLGGLLAKSLL